MSLKAGVSIAGQGDERRHGSGRPAGSLTTRIGLLHLAPEPGQVEQNRALIEAATRFAAQRGAQWIVSGELVVSGYTFSPMIGTGWIQPQPDPWMRRYAELGRDLDVSLFVNHPERGSDGFGLFNTVFVIDRSGQIAGRHRKICVTPGSEDWSTAGDSVEVIEVDGVRVGVLICADLHPPGPAARLKDLGAQVIVSAAAWHPGAWGPAGEWEARSVETQLPVVVCNRTGGDREADFSQAESVVVVDGRKLATLRSPRSAVFIVDLTIGPATTRAEVVGRHTISGWTF